MNRHGRRIQAARERRASGRIERIATAPAMHEQVKKRIRLAVVQAHEDHDLATGKMLQKYQVSCKPGCSACCRMPVDATVEEALVIVKKYPDLVRELRPEIEAQSELFDAMCGQFDDWTEHQSEIARQWWNENRMCAFLREGSCSIYEARPLPCRNYHVMSDPALCGAEAGTQVTVVLTTRAALLYPKFGDRMPHGGISMGYLPTVMKAALLMDDKNRGSEFMLANHKRKGVV